MDERTMEIMEALQYDLEAFYPVLAAFVDKEYRTVIGSEVSSEGVIQLERGLAKNQEPFGIFIVQYDLKEEKALSQELQVTNGKFADEWRSFKE